MNPTLHRCIANFVLKDSFSFLICAFPPFHSQVIFGKSGGPEFLHEVYTPVTYHNKQVHIYCVALFCLWPYFLSFKQWEHLLSLPDCLFHFLSGPQTSMRKWSWLFQLVLQRGIMCFSPSTTSAASRNRTRAAAVRRSLDTLWDFVLYYPDFQTYTQEKKKGAGMLLLAFTSKHCCTYLHPQRPACTTEESLLKHSFCKQTRT